MHRFALVAAIAVLLVACSGTSSDTVSTELAAPSAETVPSDWTTYTDETSGLSLSYPNDWDAVPVDEAAIAALFDSMVDVLFADTNIAVVFTAGLPTSDGGFNPNVSVVAVALVVDMTLDEYVEAQEPFASEESTERVKTVVAGREVVVEHGSFDLSELDPSLTGRSWTVSLSAIDGRTGWTVNCGAVSAVLEPDLEVCDAIVRTFNLSSS